MITFVQLAYGDERILQQARFSIASLQHWALKAGTPYRVVVYTDQPDRFGGLGPHVGTELLDASQLREWRGAIDYVHRIKPVVLLRAAAKYGGTIVFMDSDTYLVADPFPRLLLVDERTAVLHLCEGRLSERKNGIFRKMHRFVKRARLPMPGGEVVRISPDAEMWNSGVVALHDSVAAGVIERTIQLIDAIHAQYRKHITEQLALSWVLHERGFRMLPSDDIVAHYWPYTRELAPVIAGFLARHEGDDVATVGAAAVALAPRGTPKPLKRPWWQRLLGRRA